MAARRPRITAAEQRRLELQERAHKRRSEIAAELQNSTERLAAAAAFVRRWDGTARERAESQSFWNELLAVFGIDRRPDGVEFERAVPKRDSGGQGFIDVFWPRVLLAEQKSLGRDLKAALDQADNYEIPPDEEPRLTVVSDFARIAVRDNATDREVEFALAELPSHLGWFGPLVADELRELAPDVPVSVAAAERMALLFDELRAAGFADHQLRVLLVRLVFCMFADDTRIWPKGAFDAYLRSVPPEFAGPALAKLFEVLDTPSPERSANLPSALAVFPHVGGELFQEQLAIPDFSAEMTRLLLECSEGVDWSRVSPAVFGSLFQGVMAPQERRDLGAHYTSEENILKVIEPLFLDDLHQRLADADTLRKLERLWDELAQLEILDPAAGCGNFLVVSYRELRALERRLLSKLAVLAENDPRVLQRYPWALGSQRLLEFGRLTRLDVGQFHGIEVDEWPARIAQVAMWLTDHLANMELEDRFGGHQVRLPLDSTAHIHVANALRLDWDTVLPKARCSYVLGNPPFIGTNLQSPDQKADTVLVWGKTRGSGSLDYVCNWFRQAATYAEGTGIRIAFVSTNSVSQGEQPPVLWGYLSSQDMHIDFAHCSFNWRNEARGRAAVHVVIIGFSQGYRGSRKPLWTYDDVNRPGIRSEAVCINAYLAEGPEILVGSSKVPLGGFPKMLFGSMARDGGHLFLTPEEAAEVRKSDPAAAKYLRRIYGAAELIQGKERWCFWLVDADPADPRSSPILRTRLAAVAAVRLASPAASTRAAAATPGLFVQNGQPKSRWLAVPRVSSENRPYVPMAFFEPDVIASDALLTIDGATDSTFGILSSRPFTLWLATVSGRLESRYRISAEITYNNFPWPDLDEARTVRIEAAAKAVLAARDQFPQSTLAELYDPLAMPGPLVKAHKALDREVLAAYGLTSSATDAEILALLFERYAALSTALSTAP